MTDSRDLPNVLLVVMDSVRAANVGLYGHEHDTTPFLSEFAEQAVVYEQARSPGIWSLPSHTSMFTGLHVVEHGVTRARHKLQPNNTIFETLGKNYNYTTGVFSENTWLSDMDVGLRDAFDTVVGAQNLLFPDAVDPSNFVLSEGQGQYISYLKHCLSADAPAQSLANGVFAKLAWDYPHLLPDGITSSTPASTYTDLFLDWETDRSEPWAACVNYMDAHLPYLPSSEHDLWGGKELRKLQSDMDDQVWEFSSGERPWWQRRALEGLYDGTIHQMDAEIERLVSELEARDKLENTLVVVTADHGEGFGEPSRIRPDSRVAAHSTGIHEVLTHVPLLAHFPGETDRSVVSDVASLTRFPSVVEAVVDGDSDPERRFIPENHAIVSSHGLEEPMENRARRYVDDLYRFNGDARAVYEGSGDDVSKYVSWRNRRATVLSHDAKSSYRRTEDDEGRVDATFDQFTDRGVREDSGGMDDVDDATKQRLEDLGYV
ncbi:choline-sulfatase [Halarchaeum acidiphilum MH1-52-1]|uniref:Choline-sulfatase n=1 Tax=Halarchaeum acidiphilum MH1-52-1 TaxID=1261545 RepID=U2YWV2_9EURY|nr:sulfatase [Halarchaeum acidiphilum]GAD53520.1 choline-sulfatase [Halarchaeum acidiphilum MH1-52-1]